MSGEDKRYEPTPARRQRARRDGNVARSAELGNAAAFGAAVVATFLAVPLAVKVAATAIGTTAALLPRARGGSPLLAATELAMLAVAALVPAVAAAVAGTACAFAQAGGLHLGGIHLDLKRLDPFAGLKRMLGGEAAVGAARAVLAFAAAVGAMAPVGVQLVGGAAQLGSPRAAALLVAGAALRAWCAAFAVAAAFAIADYALARRRWLRGLRMSLDEIKREAKENEGDPQARARRKTVHRSIVRGAVSRTCEASFVVVNPEHVAVALRYAPPAVPVPTILVRALDEAALRVKALARELAIPVVEDVGLARLLYASGENDRPIPADAYVAVAQIVASLAREGLLACDPG